MQNEATAIGDPTTDGLMITLHPGMVLVAHGEIYVKAAPQHDGTTRLHIRHKRAFFVQRRDGEITVGPVITEPPVATRKPLK